MLTQKLLNLFRANLPVVALENPAPEELSLIEAVAKDVAIPLGLHCYTFDLGRGLLRVAIGDGGIEFHPSDIQFKADPVIEVLEWIDELEGQALLILLDLHPFLYGDRADLQICRRIKNLCFSLQQSDKRLILMGQDIKLPADFEGLVEQLDNNLPDAKAIASILEFGKKDLAATFKEAEIPFEINLPEEANQRLIRSCQGLSEQEILKAVRLAALTERRIDNETCEVISARKLAKLKKLGVELLTVPENEVGGLENLKLWFKQRTRLFNQQISGSTSKLPPPKGILLVGLPGTGKSLIAKTIGHLWSVPILRFDMGAMFSSLVGESEQKLRQLLASAESIAPAILLVDELDKAFAAASGPSTDSGVGLRLVGTFLTWMQEKKAAVFVVATANDISGLPPELSRKGRFDEVFWVDLPSTAERLEILRIYFNHYEIILDPQIIAAATGDWSGAELEQLTKDALTSAEFAERSVAVEDFLGLINSQSPLAHREATKVAALREWARSARSASLPDEPPAATPAKNTSRKTKMLL